MRPLSVATTDNDTIDGILRGYGEEDEVEEEEEEDEGDEIVPRPLNVRDSGRGLGHPAVAGDQDNDEETVVILPGTAVTPPRHLIGSALSTIFEQHSPPLSTPRGSVPPQTPSTRMLFERSTPRPNPDSTIPQQWMGGSLRRKAVPAEAPMAGAQIDQQRMSSDSNWDEVDLGAASQRTPSAQGERRESFDSWMSREWKEKPKRWSLKALVPGFGHKGKEKAREEDEEWVLPSALKTPEPVARRPDSRQRLSASSTPGHSGPYPSMDGFWRTGRASSTEFELQEMEPVHPAATNPAGLALPLSGREYDRRLLDRSRLWRDEEEYRGPSGAVGLPLFSTALPPAPDHGNMGEEGRGLIWANLVACSLVAPCLLPLFIAGKFNDLFKMMSGNGRLIPNGLQRRVAKQIAWVWVFAIVAVIVVVVSLATRSLKKTHSV